MGTLRDRNMLEEMWQAGKAPWKVWAPEPVWTPAVSQRATAPVDAPARTLPEHLLAGVL
jgi:glucose-1-phosphate cytidylyltransferase